MAARPAPAPIRLTVSGPGGRCLDIDHSSIVPGTKIQLWDCNGTQAQRWTRPADGTLRALGMCADVPGGHLKVALRCGPTSAAAPIPPRSGPSVPTAGSSPPPNRSSACRPPARSTPNR
ncbi:ricin-type beta-trefoil lectin domain protein [Kribbella steppae]|uniref:ricin-type beta-trefoil lectin domain protein n=1 Tax=Kribbella steppae TaxID=2512223 RepID=UPI0010439AB1